MTNDDAQRAAFEALSFENAIAAKQKPDKKPERKIRVPANLEQLPSPPITAWSFSRLVSFEECPHRIYLQSVKKEPQPPRDENHPLERGKRIHTLAEDYTQGKLATLPKELSKFADEFQELRAWYEEGKITIEQDWGFNSEWGQTGWWAEDIWGRFKLDAFVRFEPDSALVIDHKTGKSWNNTVKHTQQGQSYAVAAFMRFPELEYAEVSFWYLDEGKKSRKRIYTRQEALPLLKRFSTRANALTTAVTFPPKPNRMVCNYCPYGRAHGTGACIYDASEE